MVNFCKVTTHFSTVDSWKIARNLIKDYPSVNKITGNEALYEVLRKIIRISLPEVLNLDLLQQLQQLD